MKKIFFIIIISLVIFSHECFGQKEKQHRIRNEKEIETDSVEYSLIILEPGFDFWLATQHPLNFYSKSFYESKNRLDATVWNQRYITAVDNNLYDSYINYNHGIDYGVELNFRLYYYFRYFEMKNIVILYPKSVDWVNVLIFNM